jgi:hypothetical protein
MRPCLTCYGRRAEDVLQVLNVGSSEQTPLNIANVVWWTGSMVLYTCTYPALALVGVIHVEYALESAAKERAIVFVTAISEPISGNGPCGTFALAQLITLEFALLLPSHLSEVTLTKPHSTINASAVQKLASGAKVGSFSIIACVSRAHQYRANRQWHPCGAPSHELRA